VRGGQGTDLDGGGALFSMWNCVEKLSKIIHRRRKYHLIVRALRYLENRNSNDLTDDLGINSDNMPSNSGLKHQPAVIIPNHLEVGIE
jgi:hypothetical protein